MKKILYFLLAVMLCGLFAGCGDKGAGDGISSGIVGTWVNNNRSFVFNADGSGYQKWLGGSGYEIAYYDWALTQLMLHLTYDGSGTEHSHYQGTYSYFYTLESNVLSLWYDDGEFMDSFVKSSGSNYEDEEDDEEDDESDAQMQKTVNSKVKVTYKYKNFVWDIQITSTLKDVYPNKNFKYGAEIGYNTYSWEMPATGLVSNFSLKLPLYINGQGSPYGEELIYWNSYEFLMDKLANGESLSNSEQAQLSAVKSLLSKNEKSAKSKYVYRIYVDVDGYRYYVDKSNYVEREDDGDDNSGGNNSDENPDDGDENEPDGPQGSTNTVIYYKSTDGKIVEPNDTSVFGAKIVSNTYNNGEGKIVFDGVVTKIGYRAFQECTTLRTITIPNSVTEIFWFAFLNCSGLRNIDIPNNVTNIGDSAFQYCTSLTSVNIGNGVTIIGGSAFSGCSSLTSVNIGDSVKEIRSYAFSNTAIRYITIPYSVTTISIRVFQHCKYLTAIYGKFTSDDNRCVVIDGELIAFAPAGLTSYSVPNGVIKIAQETFSSTDLINVTIPNSVTEIGYSAFSYCYKLTGVYCESKTPPVVRYNSFISNASNRKIYVPKESVDAYKNADGWKEYADAIVGYDF